MPCLIANETYPSHLLAQNLNNRAAFCIETGRYDIAITNLLKVLKICEDFDEDVQETCQCRYCSLEACMTYSQGISSEQFTNDDLSPSSSDMNNSGYVYRQPIRVTPQAMKEGHSLGTTLPLIATFNMALAHHLSAIEESKTISRREMHKVLKLYELAYRWQMEDDENPQVDSLRFTMIIANNLGEIHRAVNNHSKHQKCMQHLLSTMMFLVDCHDEKNLMNMDGFLRNTTKLILHDHCAAAA